MRVQAECIPCLFRQALTTARLVAVDEIVELKLMQEVAKFIATQKLVKSPAEHTSDVLEIVYQTVDHDDPYRTAKHEYNHRALALYPRLQELVANAPDNRLERAAQLAVAGNIIDLGIQEDEIDIEASIEGALKSGFKIDHLQLLQKALAQPDNKKLLYIADNAGELVFDMVFVEELVRAGIALTVAVKSGPILNDATIEDAAAIGLDVRVKVITTGNAMVGVVLEHCSQEFRSEFDSADIIISKGQGNYETLDESARGIFFALKAKCSAVARSLGVNQGDLVFMRK